MNAAKTVTTKTGIVVTMERRPTVDKAWVVYASHDVGGDQTMIDLHVVEPREDREQVLVEMTRKHGGRR